MDITSQFSVLYTCRVAKSGYELEGMQEHNRQAYYEEKRVVDTKTDIEIVRTRLRPRFKPVTYINREFTYEAVRDFLDLGQSRGWEEDSVNRLKFYNKWGPLEDKDETNADFDFLRHRFFQALDAHQKQKPNHFHIDLRCEFVTNEENKLIPAIKAPNLRCAIEAAWFLSVQHPVEIHQCQFFKDFGYRKSCKKHFQVRGKKKFCSEGCRSVYNIKKKGIAK